MVENEKDLRLYEGTRYQFALLIAEAWFKLIRQLSKEQLMELKHDLKGRTIVGEYCGNPDYQHLVKYANTTIYFYALVENSSQHTCLLPD